MYRYASKINLIKLHKLNEKSERLYNHFGKTIAHSTFKSWNQYLGRALDVFLEYASGEGGLKLSEKEMMRREDCKFRYNVDLHTVVCRNGEKCDKVEVGKRGCQYVHLSK